MQKLNIHETKTKLSAVLSEVEKKGETFLICRNGVPVAELIPHRRSSRLRYHPVMSKIDIGYDPLEDLSGDEWGEIE
ncbi:MAG: type II toxin-antitoxin system prevent-host-death family antitoxin [Desulfobacteraceae bacterium]|nr:MAG: type II toxin-antitoxin system prevent-host-death family antitoxin [Desulfobacteraceae bacterium]